MLKVTGLHDACCRKYCKRYHCHDIRIHLEDAFTYPQYDGKRKSNPNHIFLERSCLHRSSFDLKFYRLCLERIKLHEKEPCNEEHDDHIRNHPEHPSCECDRITCLLKSTESYGIRRSTDRSTHTSDVCRDRDCKSKRDPSAAILRECRKDWSKEGEHHRCCRSVAHEHREDTDDKQDTEKDCLGICTERLEHHFCQLYVKTHLGSCERKDETSEEEHDDRVGECRHDILIIGQSSDVFLCDKESEALVGCRKKNRNDSDD